jgi:hypothetical protein
VIVLADTQSRPARSFAPASAAYTPNDFAMLEATERVLDT